jgi:hypothetical protein
MQADRHLPKLAAVLEFIYAFTLTVIFVPAFYFMLNNFVPQIFPFIILKDLLI